MKYKENPTITRIVGLVRVAGVEPANKWLYTLIYKGRILSFVNLFVKSC
nr:MAG TPA: hypothetical protein [Caudoviricetes sp.]